MKKHSPPLNGLSEEHIMQTIQSCAEDTVAFLATSELGFERLKTSVDSRGDPFDRCGSVVFEEYGEEILRIPISCLPATIGSSRSADYPLSREGISRMHCHLEKIGNLVRIHDDMSTNGVLLNGKWVDAEDLCDGDELRLGSVIMRLRKA